MQSFEVTPLIIFHSSRKTEMALVNDLSLNFAKSSDEQMKTFKYNCCS